jgi:lysozyme
MNIERTNLTPLEAKIVGYEGWKNKVYKDTLGIETIGVGFNLTNGIPDAVILFWLRYNIEHCKKELESFDWYEKLSEKRKNVLIDMVYNMGILRFSTFKKMIQYIIEDHYELAAMEMLNSKWSSQVGRRAIELADEMAHG